VRLLCLLLALATLPVPAFAQSLGDAARKEEARRKKNRDQGVKAPLFDDSKISKKNASSPAPAASPATTAPTEPSESPTPDVGDAEAEQRKQQEELWRGRMTGARNQRDEAKKNHDVLKALSLAPLESFVDEQGRTVVRDAEHLRQLIAEAKARWDAAEQAISDLEDSARRAGALPGWLR
jgi:hypothetical protein